MPEASVSQDKARGKWEVAIPLPYYKRFGRLRCNECGRIFWGRRKMQRYRAHWRKAHVLPYPCPTCPEYSSKGDCGCDELTAYYEQRYLLSEVKDSNPT